MKVDYRMQYYDVITNPRWRTSANTKIVTSVYLSVKCSRLMQQNKSFGHFVRLWSVDTSEKKYIHCKTEKRGHFIF